FAHSRSYSFPCLRLHQRHQNDQAESNLEARKSAFCGIPSGTQVSPHSRCRLRFRSSLAKSCSGALLREKFPENEWIPKSRSRLLLTNRPFRFEFPIP